MLKRKENGTSGFTLWQKLEGTSPMEHSTEMSTSEEFMKFFKTFIDYIWKSSLDLELSRNYKTCLIFIQLKFVQYNNNKITGLHFRICCEAKKSTMWTHILFQLYGNLCFVLVWSLVLNFQVKWNYWCLNTKMIFVDLLKYVHLFLFSKWLWFI